MLECRGKGREKRYLRLLCLILCMKSISYCLLSPTPAMPGESSVPKLLTICKLGNSPLTSGSNCRVQGSPMTTFRFNNLLGHIELTESCYTQSMVYFSKRMLIKISQWKIHETEFRRVPNAELPVFLSVESWKALTISGSDIWQHTCSIANWITSFKPWCSEFLLRLHHIDMIDYLCKLTSVSSHSWSQTDTVTQSLHHKSHC